MRILPLLALLPLLLSSHSSAAPKTKEDLAYEQGVRNERDGYTTAAEALHSAHQKFNDFKGRYSLVREANPAPNRPKLMHYRLWDDATRVRDKQNRATTITPWVEEWFYWGGNANGRLIKGKRLYIVVANQASPNSNRNKLQAYLRFYTKIEWERVKHKYLP